jgi:hypothetical protein
MSEKDRKRERKIMEERSKRASVRVRERER